LKYDSPIPFVDGIGERLKAWNHIVLVDARLESVVPSQGIHKEVTRYDQADLGRGKDSVFLDHGLRDRACFIGQIVLAGRVDKPVFELFFSQSLGSKKDRNGFYLPWNPGPAAGAMQ
jgi:hypothetical protein